MIEREQIAEALGRLDAREREILDYSLRRRVPDDDLAALFDSEPAEVARRRAGAIEALSSDLGAQRGADLGHILKELLEGATWDMVEGADPVPDPDAAEPESPEESDSEPVADHPPLGASARPAAETGSSDEPEPERVLGMLSGEQASGAAAAAEPAGRGRGRRRVLVGVAAAAAVLVPAGMVAALATDSDSDNEPAGSASSGTREFSPTRDGAGSAEPFPSDPQSAEEYPTARINKRTALYREPGGRVRLRIAPKTEWDSPRILSIVERRGRWMAVLVPELKNGQQAWVREDQVANLSSVTWAVRADLSKRTLKVRHNGRTVRTMKMGIGRVDNPTPPGRYAVTDKLRVSDPNSPYGCCVLALTGHQTKLPKGWPGGDRLAVHATRDLSGLGRRVSLGCMRTDPRDTKWMMKRVPLGTPVFVEA